MRTAIASHELLPKGLDLESLSIETIPVPPVLRKPQAAYSSGP